MAGASQVLRLPWCLQSATRSAALSLERVQPQAHCFPPEGLPPPLGHAIDSGPWLYPDSEMPTSSTATHIVTTLTLRPSGRDRPRFLMRQDKIL